ncbi:MAG: dTDP-glucose 4,6-dehydratase [Phycisphaerales bacterium]
MSILVTGGAGFIGANFVHSWLGVSNEPVVNLDTLTYAGALENLHALEHDSRHCFVRGDIADSECVRSILVEHSPRAVIHFAAETHVDRSITDPEAFVQTNVVGTARLLEECRRYWDGLEDRAGSAFRFVHVSTDEVYGSLGEGDAGFDELSKYEPNSPYSASKAAADHFVRAYFQTYGLPALITNCSNNYGPMQHEEKLIPLMITRAIAGLDLPVYGDGQQSRDWLFVDDHNAAIRAVLRDGVVGKVYNIGGDEERVNLEVVEMICRMLDEKKPRLDGESYRLQIRFVEDRLGHDRRYAVDARKIQAELGWAPSTQFERGMERTVDWYLDKV